MAVVIDRLIPGGEKPQPPQASAPRSTTLNRRSSSSDSTSDMHTCRPLSFTQRLKGLSSCMCRLKLPEQLARRSVASLPPTSVRVKDASSRRRATVVLQGVAHLQKRAAHSKLVRSKSAGSTVSATRHGLCIEVRCWLGLALAVPHRLSWYPLCRLLSRNRFGVSVVVRRSELLSMARTLDCF